MSKFLCYVLFLCLAMQQLSAADLHQRLLDACKQQPSGAQVSCLVIDCTNNKEIFSYRADTTMRLASLTKLLVSAAALCELGPNYEFRTSIYRLSPIENNSIQHLGIIARGDPCLDEHYTDKKPNEVFEQWAGQLKNANINHIHGNIYIDNSMFSGPAKAPSFPQDHRNQQQWYSAPASAFAWNDNCIEVRALPQQAGKPCRIEYRPFSSAIKIINKTKTVSSGGNKTFIVSRLEKSNTIVVSGKYSKTTSWFPLSIHEKPDQLAADHLLHILKKAGIQIKGKAIIKPFDSHADGLLFEETHPLLPALQTLNQRSQNFYGEQIIRVLGHHYQGNGNLEFGGAAIKHYLHKHLSLPQNTLQILDGSGLSYDNKASARSIVHVLKHMHEHKHAKDYYFSLRTPIYAWAKKYPSRIKTGSLAVARCLAGYIDGKTSKKRYAFAILLNKGSAKSISWASKLRESLYKVLATNLY